MSDNVLEIRVYKEDVTKHCSPDLVQAAGGKVYNIYLFDANLVVHCCELTGSYELEFVETIAEKYPDDETEREKLFETLQEAGACNDDIAYRSIRGFDLSQTKEFRTYSNAEWEEVLDEQEGSKEQARHEIMENCLEQYRCNPVY